MPAGCPRTVSFSPDEMVKLGEEMISWLEDPTREEVLHLSEWYTIHKMFTYKQWKAFIQRPEFLPYYEKALKIVGKKYLRKDSNAEPNIKNRWQRVYFADVKEEEDEKARIDSEIRMKEMEHAVKLRKEEVLSYTEEQAERHKCLLDMLKDYQSALLSDSTSSSTESKS